MQPTETGPLDPLTKWLLAAPSNLGRLLLILAALWAVPVAYGGYKVYQNRPVEKKVEEKPEGENTEKPLEAAEKLPDPNRTNHFVLLAFGAVGGLGCLAGALWAFYQTPGRPADERRTASRVAVLLAGVGSGLLLMLGGLWFVIDQYDVLSKWLDTREGKDLWKVLVPVLVFIVGGALAFFAAQLTRPEERHSQTARRLVYATNLLVTGLLLFVALAVVNIFFGTKLPNRLDTTGTGFYTLSPSTEQFIGTLDQKVTVYSFLEEGVRGHDELKVMLANLQDLNPAAFVVRNYGINPPTKESQQLRTKFPQANLNETALILALGDDEKRYSTVKHEDIVRVDRDPRTGRPSGQFFEGEKVLVRELLFLAENKSKPVVYFTQGSGELNITPGPDALGRDQSAVELKGYLEKLNFEVKPLPFAKEAPKVPADATVVIVADPKQTIATAFAAELKKYVSEPQANGKKGKLIVIAGPTTTVKNDGVQDTGLEDVLAGFNIKLVKAFLMNVPTQRTGPDNIICTTDLRAVSANNPIAGVLPPPGRMFPVGPARPLELTPPAEPTATIETYPLITTIGGNRMPSWLEPVRPADPNKELDALLESEEVQIKKKISATRRPVAAVATEGGVGRVVVFGTVFYFTDEVAAQFAASPDANIGHAMISTAIDWLRDRPTVDVVNKPYGTYKANPSMDAMRLLVLPVVLAALTIIGFGAGVWVVRRK